jgi:transcriptional regulator with XRE-family HTH domain
MTTRIAVEDTLEPYRVIVTRIMQRQGLKTAVVAREIGCERTHLAKVRSGERRIKPAILEKLIQHLGVDRQRMTLAVVMMNSPDLYFDPRFRNISYFVELVVSQTMKFSQSEDAIDHRQHVGVLSKERCGQIALSTAEELAGRFGSARRNRVASDHG